MLEEGLLALFWIEMIELQIKYKFNMNEIYCATFVIIKYVEHIYYRSAKKLQALTYRVFS